MGGRWQAWTSGKAVDTWEDFLAEIAKTGSYAGDAELKALCRIFDIRVIFVPEAPQFPVCVFHRKASVKRTLAIFHTHHHFDYLAPADKSYPEEITQVSADLSGAPNKHGHRLYAIFPFRVRENHLDLTRWEAEQCKATRAEIRFQG